MKVDVLISGMGIAGAVLAETLMQKGVRVAAVDPLPANSSSRVAAGIFNPVNTRRFTSHWWFSRFYEAAIPFYKNLETGSGHTLLHSMDSCHILSSAEQQNEWEVRMADGQFDAFIATHGCALPAEVLAEYGAIRFGHSGYVDTGKLIQTVVNKMRQSETFLQAEFLPHRLQSNKKISFGKFEADVLVQCGGFSGGVHPLFGTLPFYASKGELLTLNISGFAPGCMLHKGVYLLPVGEDNFICGATYSHTDLTSNPTQHGASWITQRLNNLLNLPYEITGYLAAVRPTVKDRRPLLGVSPAHPRVFILNGLGTKGILMAPLLAQILSSHIFDGVPLPPETDVNRFANS